METELILDHEGDGNEDWSIFAPVSPRAVEAEPEERAAFIRRTYMHVGAALLGFVVLEFAIFQTRLPAFFLQFLSISWFTWLVLLAAFSSVARFAESWAESEMSKEQQYGALGIYVLAQSVLFSPFIRLAQFYGGKSVIYTCVLLTLMLFTGLTVAVFATQEDFSRLQAGLCIGVFVIFGLVVCWMLFGFSTGVICSEVTVSIAAAAILFQTSRVMNYYRVNQHVAASLALFASMALLFWYVMRIFIWLRRRRYE